MIRGLWSAASGMQAQQMNIDVVANNLANVNTTGFKKSRVNFQDLLYSTIKAAGTEVATGLQIPTGIQVGNGSRTVATQKIFSQGDYMQTENPLDLIIEGDGFFQVLKPDGAVAYSRDGAFKVDSEGKVVNSDGFVLQPEIVLPSDATDLNVGIDGTVTVLLAGDSTAQNLGSIELVKFINPAGLKSIGKNLYEVTGASGDPVSGMPGEDGLGTIATGFLEMSNVKVVEEMVNMIVAQRAYEINAKAIQATDDMLQQANRIKR
ncbi:MAG: flagellar basal-body rod protein FlgG [Candidatus Omnitrophota bacterium]|nr:MAG: flagellar basal-body rod protein FlgG [Candidatus Omnitrophota bacterium]